MGTVIGMQAVHDLREKTALFPNGNRHTLKPVLIASGGVTSHVRQESDVSIVELTDFWSQI